MEDRKIVRKAISAQYPGDKILTNPEEVFTVLFKLYDSIFFDDEISTRLQSNNKNIYVRLDNYFHVDEIENNIVIYVNSSIIQELYNHKNQSPIIYAMMIMEHMIVHVLLYLYNYYKPDDIEFGYHGNLFNCMSMNLFKIQPFIDSFEGINIEIPPVPQIQELPIPSIQPIIEDRPKSIKKTPTVKRTPSIKPLSIEKPLLVEEPLETILVTREDTTSPSSIKSMKKTPSVKILREEDTPKIRSIKSKKGTPFIKSVEEPEEVIIQEITTPLEVEIDKSKCEIHHENIPQDEIYISQQEIRDEDLDDIDLLNDGKIELKKGVSISQHKTPGIIIDKVEDEEVRKSIPIEEDVFPSIRGISKSIPVIKTTDTTPRVRSKSVPLRGSVSTTSLREEISPFIIPPSSEEIIKDDITPPEIIPTPSIPLGEDISPVEHRGLDEPIEIIKEDISPVKIQEVIDTASPKIQEALTDNEAFELFETITSETRSMSPIEIQYIYSHVFDIHKTTTQEELFKRFLDILGEMEYGEIKQLYTDVVVKKMSIHEIYTKYFNFNIMNLYHNVNKTLDDDLVKDLFKMLVDKFNKLKSPNERKAVYEALGLTPTGINQLDIPEKRQEFYDAFRNYIINSKDEYFVTFTDKLVHEKIPLSDIFVYKKKKPRDIMQTSIGTKKVQELFVVPKIELTSLEMVIRNLTPEKINEVNQLLGNYESTVSSIVKISQTLQSKDLLPFIQDISKRTFNFIKSASVKNIEYLQSILPFDKSEEERRKIKPEILEHFIIYSDFISGEQIDAMLNYIIKLMNQNDTEEDYKEAFFNVVFKGHKRGIDIMIDEKISDFFKFTRLLTVPELDELSRILTYKKIFITLNPIYKVSYKNALLVDLHNEYYKMQNASIDKITKILVTNSKELLSADNSRTFKLLGYPIMDISNKLFDFIKVSHMLGNYKDIEPIIKILPGEYKYSFDVMLPRSGKIKEDMESIYNNFDILEIKSTIDKEFKQIEDVFVNLSDKQYEKVHKLIKFSIENISANLYRFIKNMEEKDTVELSNIMKFKTNKILELHNLIKLSESPDYIQKRLDVDSRLHKKIYEIYINILPHYYEEFDNSYFYSILRAPIEKLSIDIFNIININRDINNITSSYNNPVIDISNALHLNNTLLEDVNIKIRDDNKYILLKIMEIYTSINRFLDIPEIQKIYELVNFSSKDLMNDIMLYIKRANNKNMNKLAQTIGVDVSFLYNEKNKDKITENQIDGLYETMMRNFNDITNQQRIAIYERLKIPLVELKHFNNTESQKDIYTKFKAYTQKLTNDELNDFIKLFMMDRTETLYKEIHKMLETEVEEESDISKLQTMVKEQRDFRNILMKYKLDKLNLEQLYKINKLLNTSQRGEYSLNLTGEVKTPEKVTDVFDIMRGIKYKSRQQYVEEVSKNIYAYIAKANFVDLSFLENILDGTYVEVSIQDNTEINLNNIFNLLINSFSDIIPFVTITETIIPKYFNDSVSNDFLIEYFENIVYKLHLPHKDNEMITNIKNLALALNLDNLTIPDRKKYSDVEAYEKDMKNAIDKNYKSFIKHVSSFMTNSNNVLLNKKFNKILKIEENTGFDIYERLRVHIENLQNYVNVMVQDEGRLKEDFKNQVQQYVTQLYEVMTNNTTNIRFVFDGTNDIITRINELWNVKQEKYTEINTLINNEYNLPQNQRSIELFNHVNKLLKNSYYNKKVLELFDKYEYTKYDSILNKVQNMLYEEHEKDTNNHNFIIGMLEGLLQNMNISPNSKVLSIISFLNKNITSFGAVGKIYRIRGENDDANDTQEKEDDNPDLLKNKYKNLLNVIQNVTNLTNIDNNITLYNSSIANLINLLTSTKQSLYIDRILLVLNDIRNPRPNSVESVQNQVEYVNQVLLILKLITNEPYLNNDDKKDIQKLIGKLNVILQSDISTNPDYILISSFVADLASNINIRNMQNYYELLTLCISAYKNTKSVALTDAVYIPIRVMSIQIYNAMLTSTSTEIQELMRLLIINTKYGKQEEVEGEDEDTKKAKRSTKIAESQKKLSDITSIYKSVQQQKIQTNKKEMKREEYTHSLLLDFLLMHYNMLNLDVIKQICEIIDYSYNYLIEIMQEKIDVSVRINKDIKIISNVSDEYINDLLNKLQYIQEHDVQIESYYAIFEGFVYRLNHVLSSASQEYYKYLGNEDKDYEQKLREKFFNEIFGGFIDKMLNYIRNNPDGVKILDDIFNKYNLTINRDVKNNNIMYKIKTMINIQKPNINVLINILRKRNYVDVDKLKEVCKIVEFPYSEFTFNMMHFLQKVNIMNSSYNVNTNDVISYIKKLDDDEIVELSILTGVDRIYIKYIAIQDNLKNIDTSYLNIIVSYFNNLLKTRISEFYEKLIEYVENDSITYQNKLSVIRMLYVNNEEIKTLSDNMVYVHTNDIYKYLYEEAENDDDISRKLYEVSKIINFDFSNFTDIIYEYIEIIDNTDINRISNNTGVSKDKLINIQKLVKSRTKVTRDEDIDILVKHFTTSMEPVFIKFSDKLYDYIYSNDIEKIKIIQDIFDYKNTLLVNIKKSIDKVDNSQIHELAKYIDSIYNIETPKYINILYEVSRLPYVNMTNNVIKFIENANDEIIKGDEDGDIVKLSKIFSEADMLKNMKVNEILDKYASSELNMKSLVDKRGQKILYSYSKIYEDIKKLQPQEYNIEYENEILENFKDELVDKYFNIFSKKFNDLNMNKRKRIFAILGLPPLLLNKLNNKKLGNEPQIKNDIKIKFRKYVNNASVTDVSYLLSVFFKEDDVDIVTLDTTKYFKSDVFLLSDELIEKQLELAEIMKSRNIFSDIEGYTAKIPKISFEEMPEVIVSKPKSYNSYLDFLMKKYQIKQDIFSKKYMIPVGRVYKGLYQELYQEYQKTKDIKQRKRGVINNFYDTLKNIVRAEDIGDYYSMIEGMEVADERYDEITSFIRTIRSRLDDAKKDLYFDVESNKIVRLGDELITNSVKDDEFHIIGVKGEHFRKIYNSLKSHSEKTQEIYGKIMNEEVNIYYNISNDEFISYNFDKDEKDNKILYYKFGDIRIAGYKGDRKLNEYLEDEKTKNMIKNSYKNVYLDVEYDRNEQKRQLYNLFIQKYRDLKINMLNSLVDDKVINELKIPQEYVKELKIIRSETIKLINNVPGIFIDYIENNTTSVPGKYEDDKIQILCDILKIKKQDLLNLIYLYKVNDVEAKQKLSNYYYELVNKYDDIKKDNPKTYNSLLSAPFDKLIDTVLNYIIGVDKESYIKMLNVLYDYDILVKMRRTIGDTIIIRNESVEKKYSFYSFEDDINITAQNRPTEKGVYEINPILKRLLVLFKYDEDVKNYILYQLEEDNKNMYYDVDKEDNSIIRYRPNSDSLIRYRKKSVKIQGEFADDSDEDEDNDKKPKNPQFGKYKTKEKYVDIYEPVEEDYGNVIDYDVINLGAFRIIGEKGSERIKLFIDHDNLKSSILLNLKIAGNGMYMNIDNYNLYSEDGVQNIKDIGGKIIVNAGYKTVDTTYGPLRIAWANPKTIERFLEIEKNVLEIQKMLKNTNKDRYFDVDADTVIEKGSRQIPEYDKDMRFTGVKEYAYRELFGNTIRLTAPDMKDLYYYMSILDPVNFYQKDKYVEKIGKTHIEDEVTVEKKEQEQKDKIEKQKMAKSIIINMPGRKGTPKQSVGVAIKNEVRDMLEELRKEKEEQEKLMQQKPTKQQTYQSELKSAMKQSKKSKVGESKLGEIFPRFEKSTDIKPEDIETVPSVKPQVKPTIKFGPSAKQSPSLKGKTTPSITPITGEIPESSLGKKAPKQPPKQPTLVIKSKVSVLKWEQNSCYMDALLMIILVSSGDMWRTKIRQQDISKTTYKNIKDYCKDDYEFGKHYDNKQRKNVLVKSESETMKNYATNVRDAILSIRENLNNPNSEPTCMGLRQLLARCKTDMYEGSPEKGKPRRFKTFEPDVIYNLLCLLFPNLLIKASMFDRNRNIFIENYSSIPSMFYFKTQDGNMGIYWENSSKIRNENKDLVPKNFITNNDILVFLNNIEPDRYDEPLGADNPTLNNDDIDDSSGRYFDKLINISGQFYKLFGVVIAKGLQGKGADTTSAHYTCYVLIQEKWYYYDGMGPVFDELSDLPRRENSSRTRPDAFAHTGETKPTMYFYEKFTGQL